MKRRYSPYPWLQENWYIALIFLAGLLVRLIAIQHVPPGLNTDEASIGYEAYSIMKYGIDRNGVHLPVHLISWGSGQNALYAYLSIPFIYLFGLNPLSVRMLSIVFGLAGMIIFWLLARRISPRKSVQTILLFMIAINPWHIMMSRWALESNIFPTVVLAAVYLLVKGFEQPRWLYGSTALFALALYAYGTAYFFVPVFLVAAAVMLYIRKLVKPAMLLVQGALFAILALPILLFLIINQFEYSTIATPLFSIPRLTSPRVDMIATALQERNLHVIGDNVLAFLRIFIYQSDGLPWNSLEPYGFIYQIGLPFLLVGLIVAVNNGFRRKHTPQALIVIWFVVAVLMTLITDVNINRINIIFFPVILLTGLGVAALLSKARVLAAAACVAFTVLFLLFVNSYFQTFPQRISPAFHESFGEAIQYAHEQAQGEIQITNNVNMPYIYVLFYLQISPHEFLETVEYINPGGAFQWVRSFGRYSFTNPEIIAGNNMTYIVPNREVPDSLEGMTVTRFTHYSVIYDSRR